MSATEELRRLLDEREVEWWPSAERWCEDAITYWRVGVMKWTAIEGEKDLWLNAGIADYEPLTPEQAIAATLGPCSDSCNCTNGERTGERIDLDAPTLGVTDVKGIRLDGAGTCHVMTIGEFNGEGTEYYDYCSNCGYEYDDDPLNYCPNCGRRIEVDDD